MEHDIPKWSLAVLVAFAAGCAAKPQNNSVDVQQPQEFGAASTDQQMSAAAAESDFVIIRSESPERPADTRASPFILPHWITETEAPLRQW
jgi:hypothetical protein